MKKGYPLTYVTSTACKVMAINRPSSADGRIIEEVINAKKSLDIYKVDKFLFYSPDAVGRKLILKYPDEFKKVRKFTPIEVKIQSVYPPKTPVCYATMLTGTLPEVHGIKVYEKKTINTLSLFDSLVRYRMGTQVASIAVKDSSMDILFRNRHIQYFTEIYDKEVNDRAIELIKNKQFEFIFVYNQEYDDSLHRTGITSPESINAMKNHINNFTTLVQQCEKSWKEFNRAYLFAPDHGAHDFKDTRTGTHGDNIPADMDLIHFWGIYKGREK
ncbi:MAG: alkaline phosphatase family protein [bacterium]|nr:alkaline phosphatase family protein [bacterium]